MQNKLGPKGEDIAAEYLRKKGYKLLHKNWRKGHHEIDLIVRNSNCIVFVEVKTRSSRQYGPPELAVSWKKQRHLAQAADGYMKQLHSPYSARFDILSIVIEGNRTNIMHFEDAFWPGVF